jgi:threonine/homoserine/homoserine lactone efflux protein
VRFDPERPVSEILQRESERNMSILAIIFAKAFVVGLSGAMMPGPVLAVAIKGSARNGFWFGPLLILGHALLELPVVLGLGLGLGGFLLKQSVLRTISIVGATVLGLMAVGMLREARTAVLPTNNPSSGSFSGGKIKAVSAGIVTSLSNPFWPLWWATLGLALIGWANKLALGRGLSSSLGLSSFYVGHIMSDLLWYSFVSFMIATGRKLFTDRGYRILIGVCAIFLLALAGFFLYSGAASFFSRGPLART